MNLLYAVSVDAEDDDTSVATTKRHKRRLLQEVLKAVAGMVDEPSKDIPMQHVAAIVTSILDVDFTDDHTDELWLAFGLVTATSA